MAAKKKKTTKQAPKLSSTQLATLVSVAESARAPSAYDGRTLRSLIGKKLVAGRKIVGLTAAGKAYLAVA